MNFQMNPKFEKLRTMISFLGRERLRPLGLEADAQGHALPPDHPFFKEVLEMGLSGGFAGKMREPRADDDYVVVRLHQDSMNLPVGNMLERRP